jgi:hypothetical protein
MTPTLVGYFPKHLYPPPPFLSEAGVKEVGSVSRCIAAGPEGWHEDWRHNEWGCFNDPDTAWSLIPPERRPDFRLYGYEVYPVEYSEREAQGLEMRPLEVAPLTAAFSPVGWDAVSVSGGQGFECSPLSCNSMVERFPVNEYCLVDLPDAHTLAATAERDGCEPGPYLVVKVWRRDA